MYNVMYTVYMSYFYHDTAPTDYFPSQNLQNFSKLIILLKKYSLHTAHYALRTALRTTVPTYRPTLSLSALD